MSSVMENCWDFLEWLGPDTSTSVLVRLDDPADLARASSVSRSWRQFIVANGFCKKLCLKMCPEASIFTRIIEVSSSVQTAEIGSSTAIEWTNLEREHGVFTYLSHCFVSPMKKRNCIRESLCASSTDNDPDESIEHTLVPTELLNTRPSYWSSKGTSDPGVPETLSYRLQSKLCFVGEINIRPFKAFFQYGFPIYSTKYVRFKMGYRLPKAKRTNKGDEHGTSQQSTDDNYVWTYVSPEFPMVQEDVLQSFKFPHPVICIGGIVQIELIGRVQRQEMDGLYYICVSHVQVIGRSLSPVFDLEILAATGNPVLKYFPERRSSISPRRASDDDGKESGWHALSARIRRLRERAWNHAIVSMMLRNNPAAGGDNNGLDEEPFT